VALAGVLAVALVEMNAVSRRDAVAGRAHLSNIALKTGKPAISAANEATTIR
jgi:hypothetical protein